MPWSDVLFFFTRGIAGLVIAIVLYRVLKRRQFSLPALIASLLVVIAFYLHELWRFIPEAQYLGISILYFVSPVFYADFCAHILALVLSIFVAISGAGKGDAGA